MSWSRRHGVACIVRRVSTILEFRGAFRLVASDGERLRGKGRGTWTCRCGQVATIQRVPRCEACADGRDCGRDCTVSKLSCPACGESA
jgi:hypothetical protein